MSKELNKHHRKGIMLMALGIILLVPAVWFAYEKWVYGDICFWIVVPLLFALFTAGAVNFIRGGHVKPVEGEALAIMWCGALAVFIFMAPYAFRRYQAMDYSASILSASLVIMAFYYILLNTLNFIAAGDKYDDRPKLK